MLGEFEFACLARVIEERRKKHGFLLTAWVFLPDHWHAILFPRFPATISRLMESTKVGSTLRINARRRESGLLWQPRFFDRALRTVKEYQEKVEYIHLNPVRAGLVKYPGEWKWSSYHGYAGLDAPEQERRCGLKVDRVRLPTDEKEKPQSLWEARLCALESLRKSRDGAAGG